MKYYLAIDIGASSGRHIVGWTEGGEIRTQEVYRFPNGVHEEDGHLCWDMEALVREVKRGIEAARAAYPDIVSLSIDTWGVDYVLLRGDAEVAPVYAYRDSRTEAVIPKAHEIMPFSALYRRAGKRLRIARRCERAGVPLPGQREGGVRRGDESSAAHAG